MTQGRGYGPEAAGDATEELALAREQMIHLEGELEEARRRLFELEEFVPVGLVTVDATGCVLEANSRASRILGRAAHLRGKPFFSLFAYPYVQRISAGIEQALRGVSSDFEAALDSPDASVRLYFSPRTDGVESSVQCAIVDDSATQRAMLRARDREARWRTVLDYAPSAILTTDDGGRIEWVNRTAAQMFGSGSEYLVGTPLVAHLECEELRDMMLSDRRTRLACTGVARTADGRSMPVEFVVEPCVFGDEQQLVVVARSVEQHQRAQRDVLEMQEIERRRLGRDLHDSLGQQTVGLSMMVRMLAARAKSVDPELGRLAERASEIVNGLVTQTRELARAMYPSELESKGLGEALRALISHTREQTGIDVQLRVHERAPLGLDLEAATHLYRIVQEALNNAVRHGGAQSIGVRLYCDDQRLEVAVVDDGKGIGAEAQQGHGMGMRLMAERASIIGGSLTVSSRGLGRAKGTAVRCVVRRSAPQS